MLYWTEFAFLRRFRQAGMAGISPIEYATIRDHGREIGIVHLLRFIRIISAMCQVDRDHAAIREAKGGEG